MDDIEVEVAKLEAADAEFTRPPVKAGGAAIAVFGDTCGDFIQMIERHV
jgi:predicted enzyme related to lactoylglutathione lyase